jgi:type II secretory pathway component PulC
MPQHRLLALALSASLVAACGHAQRPAAAPSLAPVAVAGPPVVVATVPADTIRRSAIRSVLVAGPGAFLQKISVDDHPVLSGGKFHGFRILSLRADAFRGVDLKPGDVVTRIEGMPIEHPEEAIQAFNALQVASELRVDYERDGVARMLRYRIIDDDAPAPAKPTK